MSNKGITIEWAMVEDDADDGVEDDALWMAASVAPGVQERLGTTLAQSPALRTERRMAALALALFLCLMTYWLWQKQQLPIRTAHELETALQQAHAQPQRGAQPSRPLAAQSATSPQSEPATPALPGVHVKSYEWIGNRAVAEMTVQYPVAGEMRAHREHHFFAKSTGGWQRIEADPELLGPLQTLATDHFTIHYRAADASAVAESAPKLEAYYAQLRRAFGLPETDGSSRYTIDVATEVIAGAYDYSFGKRTLAVSSPTLLSIPVEMSDATVLAQALAIGVARIVVLEVTDQHDAEWKQALMQWYPLGNALHLWAVWEGDGPLHAERAQVVRWLFSDRGGAIAHPTPSSSAHEQQLCYSYAIWQMKPSDLYLPVACQDPEAQSPEDAYAPSSGWKQTRFDRKRVTVDDAFDSAVAIATVIDYVVATYGEESLPRFLAALAEHQRMATLIPAVLGISPAEFEASWRDYLAEQVQLE